MNNNENKVDVTENDKAFTYNDVLKATTKLTDEEKDALFQFYTVPNVVEILNSNVFEHCKHITEHAEKVVRVAGAIRQIYNWAKIAECAEKEFSDQYDDLPEDVKKKVVLELMNNFDFQRNCCEIMVKDYERIVKSNSTLSTIDSLIGLGKCFKELVDTGTGCNHKYEVE